MWLNYVWWVLFVCIISGYLIMDGFDIGVGLLHLLVARNDTERRIVLNSIGPIWDGNEVWLVLGGGVLFAAFPIVYAALFSGFYGAMMLVLLVLILRTVSIEFRSKLGNPRWRALWDGVFAVASLGLALLLGVAFGNIVAGVPVDAQGQVRMGSLLDLLRPFPLLLGLTTIVMLAIHGALYLDLKTEGELNARVRRWLPRLLGLFAVLAVGTDGTMLVSGHPDLGVYHQIWLLVIPLGAVVAFVVAWWATARRRAGLAFASWAALIGLLLFSVAVGLFPNLLPSTIDPSYSLTIFNAASAAYTLAVMLVVAVIGLPVVLAYLAGVNYLFRGKVRLSPHSY
jgi:cytochrome d ubiquinol oxidase subunit II